MPDQTDVIDRALAIVHAEVERLATNYGLAPRRRKTDIDPSAPRRSPQHPSRRRDDRF